MKNKQKTIIILLCMIVAFCFLPLVSFAQEGKSYKYDSIDITAQINKDSTVDITEKQSFDYIGEFHKGWRSIPFKKIDSISDIKIIDGETGRAFVYSNSVLEKTDPNSWGKYTFYEGNGAENIEWYYNLKDTKHDWIISYKVHGAIAFYQNNDEFYWNLFTDYEVPVLTSSIEIILPEEVKNQSELVYSVYTSSFDTKDVNNVRIEKRYNGIVASITREVEPKNSLTVALDWPRGLINKGDYYKDFIKVYWGVILGFIIIFLSIFGALIYWYLKEIYPMKKVTIVPQYEPKDNLPPAMVDVLMKENISKNSWPATIVDLAVRGYVKIEEIPLSELQLLFRKMLNAFPKDYNIIKNEVALEGLKDYERDFLNILFQEKNYFSTKELKASKIDQRKMFHAIKQVEKELLKELNIENKIYVVPVRQYYSILVVFCFIVSFFLLIFLTKPMLHETKQFLFLGGAVVLATLIFLISKFNPRLNKAGMDLKIDWLGFKMYLATAEKYRIQNLTPELFEKYLPYAMIFSVEKKWAKNFDSFSMSAPSWYSNNGVLIGMPRVNSTGISTFSASAFAVSFSASFTSAFASSGASGAGGGGGHAGGGGGGGGGGAS